MKPRRTFVEWGAIIIAVISMIIASYNGYVLNDKSIEHRLTAVEKQQENDQPRLQRIEEKMDKLLFLTTGSR